MSTYFVTLLSVRVRQLCGLCAVFVGLWSLEANAADLFPDANLQGVVRAILKQKQIDKPQIEETDLKTIFFFDGRGKAIADLTGLEKCVNLAEVKLSENQIQDLKPLAELKNIQSLDLTKNRIQDVSPLAGLVKLQYLQLAGNQIAKLDGLERLEALRTLSLSENQIETVTALAGLKKLNSLYLDGNRIVDVKPLSELRGVSSLGLKGNQIQDLTALGQMTDLRYTFLEGNPLADLQPLVESAEKDVAGPQRFAPYWYLYLDVERLTDAGKAQVERLKALGVRVNRRP